MPYFRISRSLPARPIFPRGVMFAAIGIVVVLGAIIGGYLLEHAEG